MNPNTEKMVEERKANMRAKQQLAKVGLNETSIKNFLEEVIDEDLHAKTVMSVSLATLGALHAGSLCIHVIGRAMAWSRGTDPKHATKQVDRLLSNGNVSVWNIADSWAKFLIVERQDVIVAVDWTEFDADDHATLAVYLVTSHGRATPLLWKTFEKSSLKGRRNEYEDEMLERLREIVPSAVRITVLADRGFGDQRRYEHMRSIGLDFIIRFREAILVSNEWGESKPAIEWLPKSGRATMVKDAAVTEDFYIVPAVVVVHDRRMADAWCVATSRADLLASEVVKLYGRRFTIEETFRDTKDIRFGMGLKATHIKNCARRDRLLLIAALAHVLLTLLGAAGEKVGLDRTLKTNTSKKRTMSLYNQGCYWYMAIPNMREDRLVLLMNAYGEVLREHQFLQSIFGII